MATKKGKADASTPWLERLRPTTILAMAVTLSMVMTTGGALAARATGIWGTPAAQPAATVVAGPQGTAPVAPATVVPETTEAPPALLPPVAPAATTWPAPAPAATPAPTPTSAASPSPTASATPSPTVETPAAAPACALAAGFDLAVCGKGPRIAAGVSEAMPCTTKSAAATCGEAGTGYALAARQSGSRLLVSYFPAFVACMPGAAASVDRFDCVRLSGGGESAPRPDNAFLEVWTDGTSVSKRTAPRDCTVSSSFRCDGIAVKLTSAGLNVEYAASSAIACAGFPDEALGAVVVRCGYR